MPKSSIDWDFVTEQIYQKNVTPIISGQIINNLLFGSHNVVRAWADKVNYPLADTSNSTRVAQFLSVTRQDPTRAKSDYLQFLKQSLLNLARRESDDQGFLNQVEKELRGLTFSQLATERLRSPSFDEEKDNPLTILATLDIPVFLTTSYHYFMEAALKAVGKTPRTEVYCWREGLEDGIPPECRTDPRFEPDIQSPLVYHFHGIDDYSASLVLTEDDYLEFLVNVTQDFGTEAIPSTVRNALSSSLLLMLGYGLDAWDLRVLLQGIIKGKPLRPRSFIIQLIPAEDGIKDTAQFQEYLEKYFGQARFDVYWGDSPSFVKALWKEWESG